MRLKISFLRAGKSLVCLLAAALFSLGLTNLIPESWVLYRKYIFVGLILICLFVVLTLGLWTWRQFHKISHTSKFLWGVVSLVMTVGWLLTPFEFFFPGALPLLSPRVFSQFVALICILDLSILFWGIGVWGIAFVEWLERKGFTLSDLSKRISFLHVGLLFIGFLIFTIFVNTPGLLHPEIYWRLPAYTSGKSILAIMFDAERMNLGGWEARQLSFFFDIIDWNFLSLCIRLGIPHFRSLTMYVFTFLIVANLWNTFTRDMKADKFFTLLMLGLLLSTPSIMFSNFYRTSKIGVSLMMVTLLCELFRILKKSSDLNEDGGLKPARILVFFLLCSLAMTLFDFLGVLFAGVLTGYCAVIYLVKRDKYRLSILLGLVISLIVWAVYFLWLGPMLMTAISGQQANNTYLTQAPLDNLIPFLFKEIPLLLMDMIRTLFGNITPMQAVFLLVLLIIAAGWVGRTSQERAKTAGEQTITESDKKNLWVARTEPYFNLLVLIAGLLVIYDLLVTRHEPILWPDVRYTYYVMPGIITMFIGFSTLIMREKIQSLIRKPGVYQVVVLCMVFMIAGNVAGIFRIQEIASSGHLTDAFKSTPLLLEGLRSLHNSSIVPDSSMLTDPIYQYFQKVGPIRIF
jgi:hypothetical protein